MPSRPGLAPGNSEHKPRPPPPARGGGGGGALCPLLGLPAQITASYSVCLYHPGCLLSPRPSLLTPLSLLSPPQDSALPKISPPGTVPTPEESDLETIKMPNSESPHQHSRFLPLLSTER